MRLGVTPVPIPNTMVKTQAADGTSLETVRESRWMPEQNERKHHTDDYHTVTKVFIRYLIEILDDCMTVTSRKEMMVP